MKTLRANFTVQRKGRKRKPGPRHPNGDLKEDKGIDPKVIAFRMPHRQEAPESLRHDPKAETPFGILNLKGVISDDQFDAGDRYAKTVKRYRSLIIGAPNDNPGSIAGFSEPAKGGTELDEEAAERLKESHSAAFEALHNAGRPALMAVNHAVIKCLPCYAAIITPLRIGLNALISHYGLTNQRKYGSS